MLKPTGLIFSLAVLLIIPMVQGVEPVQIDHDLFQAFEHENSLWFTTNDEGVFIISPSQGQMTHLEAPGDVPVNDVTCGISALGRLWLGSDDGLYYTDGDKIVWNRLGIEELPSPRVTDLAAGEGSLWVGTTKGAARYKEGSWRTFTKSDGLGDDFVTDIEVFDGAVWFGTLRGGISRYTPSGEIWEVWQSGDGLISNRVFSISCSGSRTFVATANGFSVLDLDSQMFTNFGSDQLPSSSATCCAWFEELEQAWIGTGKGIGIWEEDEENLTVIQDVEEIELGRINGLEVLDGAIWILRGNTEWFFHQTTGALAFDALESRWIRPTLLDVLIDQSGYSPGHPKRFLVQCNKKLEGSGSFRVVSGAGKEVYGGVLGERLDREDWDAYYWRGDFTELELRGNFSIEVTIGETRGESHRFEIDNNVLIEECGELIYDFLTYQKCGTTIPGYRSKPCHMDDALLPNGTHIDATGGWHCAGLWAGKYAEYDAYVLFNLLFALEMNPDFFEPIDRDEDGLSDILNHAMWGCDFLMKMQENNGSIHHEVEYIYITDGIPGNNDDRPINDWIGIKDSMLAVVGWAGTSVLIVDQQPLVAETYLDAALRSFDLNHRLIAGEPSQSTVAAAAMLASFQLNRATGNQTYLQLAEDYCNLSLRMPYSGFYGPLVPCALGYYLEINPETDFFEQIMEYIVDYADQSISIYTGPDAEYRPFCIPSFRNYRLDTEGAPALLAYSYTGNRSYLEHGLGIIDYHLGMNPYGICMLEGTGTINPPGYATFYQLALSVSDPYTVPNPDSPFGAHPGAIPQGLEMKDGKPWYDTSKSPYTGSGETWLINTNFIQSIALVPTDTGTYPMEVTESALSAISVLVSLYLIGLAKSSSLI